MVSFRSLVFSDVTETNRTRVSRESLTLRRRVWTNASPEDRAKSWSTRAVVFARCDLGGDPALGDRRAAPQLPEARRGPTTTPNQWPRISQPPVQTSTHIHLRLASPSYPTESTDSQTGPQHASGQNAVAIERAVARRLPAPGADTNVLHCPTRVRREASVLTFCLGTR
jgi:hypothetical protein